MDEASAFLLPVMTRFCDRLSEVVLEVIEVVEVALEAGRLLLALRDNDLGTVEVVVVIIC